VSRAIFSCDGGHVGSGAQTAHFSYETSTPIAVAVHPHNSFVGLDALTLMFCCGTGREVESRVTDVEFSGDGSLLYASYLEGHLWAWNLGKMEEPELIMRGMSNASTIDSIVVTDRNLVCTAGRSLRGV
jgi:hypothetical protein